MSKFKFFSHYKGALPLDLSKSIASINPDYLTDLSQKSFDKFYLIIYTKDPQLIQISRQIKQFKQNNLNSEIILLIDSPTRGLFQYYLNHDIDYPLHIHEKYTSFFYYINQIIAPSTSSLPTIKAADVRLNPNTKEVAVFGQQVNLRNKEYDLLEHLVINQGRTISKLDLLEKVWGYNPTVFSRTLETHFHSLKRRIKKDNLLHSMQGQGYLFDKLNPL